MSKLRICWPLLLAGLLLAVPAAAKFRVTVTAPTPLADLELERVAFVTVDCADTMDCTGVERKALLESQKMQAPFVVVPEQQVRAALFERGHTSYTQDLREELAEALELDAVFEIAVPFGEKGSGPFRHSAAAKNSQATVEMTLFTPDGKILLHGVGTGRPKNVVTSPERVAGNVVERILKEALE